MFIAYHVTNTLFLFLDSLLLAIYQDVQEIKLDLKEVIAQQKKSQQADAESAIAHEIRDFLATNNVNLPFHSKDEFDNFNSNLLMDAEFRENFVSVPQTI